MATFQTPLVSITGIEPHPDADRLELAKVLGYTCVIRKGAFKTGQQVVYLPEGGVIPEWLCRSLNLWSEADGKGRLAGPQGLRIKAIRLRGTVSQGLLYPLADGPSGQGIPLAGGDILPVDGGVEATEIADALGIVKYEPPVPVAFEGEVVNAHGHTLRFDIESLQSFPDAIHPGEPVVITEKIHGTWTGISFDPEVRHPDLYEGGTLVSSKGMSAKGLAFKTGASNDRNIYVRTWRRFLLEPGHWDHLVAESRTQGSAFHILGETFGRGVQDLQYGLRGTEFRVFAVGVGDAKEPSARFLSADKMEAWCARYDLRTVPELRRGPFGPTEILALRDGDTTLEGKHVREGIVISPNRDRPLLDQFAFLKLVSPNYLLRKGKATEFE